MRFELQAILWVSSLALLTGSFLISAQPRSDLPSVNTVSFPAAVVEADSNSGNLNVKAVGGALNGLPSLFGFENPQLTVPRLSIGETTNIFLRGLFTDSGQSKALLAYGDQGYALLGVGDEAFGFVLVEIQDDLVVLRYRETSKLETVLFRGTNETAE